MARADRSAVAALPSPGMLLAERYRLEAPIAAGGAGEVWRAADLVLARPVAVKLLRAGYAADPETRARFRQEARSAGCLTHAGIAQVYDYGEAGPSGPPYLVMELVPGPSLAEVLAAGPLGADRVMDVVAQVAAGLEVIHAAGMVHRDIKPGNLLLLRGGQVKITDFGIAHVAWPAPVAGSHTLIGTPAYLAPERAAGGPAIPASDLYSLGVVGYECLAGSPPYRGTPAEVAAAHRYQPFPPLPPQVPAAAAALIFELTARDPAARPGPAGRVAQRAGQIAAALNGSRAGAGVLAQTAVLAGADGDTLTDIPAVAPAIGPGSGRRGPGRPRPPWARRGLLLVLAAAVVVIAVSGWLLATAATSGAPHRAANRPVPAAHPPPAAHRGDGPGQEHRAHFHEGDGNGGGHGDGGQGGGDGGAQGGG